MKPPRAFGILVASAIVVVACATQEPVALRTGSAECYDGALGDLAFDPATGSITFDTGGGQELVQWPSGYTGRRSGSQVEIFNGKGRVLYRTGTRVGLMGEPDSGDDVYPVCAMEPISP